MLRYVVHFVVATEERALCATPTCLARPRAHLRGRRAAASGTRLHSARASTRQRQAKARRVRQQ